MKTLRDAGVITALAIACFNVSPAPLMWAPVNTFTEAVIQCADHYGPNTSDRLECLSAARDAWNHE